MADVSDLDGTADSRKEGLVELVAPPTGGNKGPASKAPVFYNPAMVQNRDLSVVVMQTLIDTGRFGDSGIIEVLDGLTGSGIRAVRFAMELGVKDLELSITGVDLKGDSIESAKNLAIKNGVDIAFHWGDLNGFCGTRRFHYIDVDPYGSPVPFLQSSLLSLRKGGILAVTATDTAALTGSVSRVARRRYGVGVGRTDFMQEMGCRVLLGYIARLAASFEISVRPLLFYSSDHFLRGYLQVDRGAKKADLSLDSVGWLLNGPPGPPKVIENPNDHCSKNVEGELMGPVWTGPLADTEFCEECRSVLEDRLGTWIANRRSIERILRYAITEETLPPGGFDLNETASYFKTSPPSIEIVSNFIKRFGHKWSRSRFSPTVIKTDAPLDVIKGPFTIEGE